MSSFIDENIIVEFVAESRDHLNAIEPDLLAMEQGGDLPAELLNRVFRAIHSIKGGAGFFAFESLKRLSHVMESVLMLVRDGKLAVKEAVMDALFAGMDRLRTMLDDINHSDGVPIDAEMDRLQAILESKGVSFGAQVKASTGKGKEKREFDLDAEDVRSALARGMNLYRATAFLRKDMKDQDLTPLDFLTNLLSVGQVLNAFLDPEELSNLGTCLETDLPFTFLFGTVLEQDLAALAARLPEAQLAAIDTKALITKLKRGRATVKAEKTPSPVATTAHEKAMERMAAPAVPVESAAVPEIAEDTSVMEVLAAGVLAADSTVDKAQKGTQEMAETLRVRVDLLTNLMNLAGELVLGRNQLMRALGELHKDVPGLNSILQNVDQVTTELQEGIMQTRMQPIGTLFNRFPRIIRDMSRQLGKQIDLQILGAEVELDKSIVELLADPLTHIIRNCADHALETPDQRSRAGKVPTGNIRLHAYHEGGQVNIAVTDDGRGIDRRKVIQKAVANGMMDAAQAAELSDREVVNLIFAPGFSLAEKVSDISGRGVGMDVVRTNVEKMGGHVDVESVFGQGTTVLLRLPLTLAIIPSMIVGVATQRFAIPQVNVVEFVWVRAAEVAQRIERVQGAYVLRLRDKLLPLVRLADVLGMERTFVAPGGEVLPDRRQELADRRGGPMPNLDDLDLDGMKTRVEDRRQDWRSDYNIVVLRLGSNQFGVIVDELFDIEEIVVKPLSAFIQNTKCFSGATITGDGRVIMILDAGGIAEIAHLHFADVQAEEKERAAENARQAALSASRRRSVIIFTAAMDEYFAVAQERVQRLERLPVGSIQHVGGHEFMEYRGHGMPLIRLDQHMSVKPIPADLEEVFVIIPKMSLKGPVKQPPAGIVISQILDALDVDVELKEADLEGPGLLGSAMLQHQLVHFLEPIDLIKASGVHGMEVV